MSAKFTYDRHTLLLEGKHIYWVVINSHLVPCKIINWEGTLLPKYFIYSKWKEVGVWLDGMPAQWML